VAGCCNRNFAVDFWGQRYFPKPQFRFPGTAHFENVVPWLVLNREGLDVLIHPLTGDSYDDHFRNAVWPVAPVR
jgi:aromatic ring-cleaving dioxygenase